MVPRRAFPLLIATVLAAAVSLAWATPVQRSGVVTAMTGPQLPTTLTLETGTRAEEATITEDTLFTTGGSEDRAFLHDPFLLFGRYLEATVESETGQATAVAVSPEFVNSGPVVNVTSAQPPADLTLETTFSGPLTVHVTEHTLLGVDNEGIESLRDLRRTLVFVSYDPTTLNALQVSGFSGFRRVRGRLLSVHPEFAELEVQTNRGRLHLSADMFPFIEDGSEASVFVEGSRAQLADLVPGMDVVVDYEAADFALATMIQAVLPRTVGVQGTTTASSLTEQTLLVKTPAAARPLRITSNTRIELNGRRVPLARVPRGSRLTGTVVRAGNQLLARRLRVQVRRGR